MLIRMHWQKCSVIARAKSRWLWQSIPLGQIPQTSRDTPTATNEEVSRTDCSGMRSRFTTDRFDITDLHCISTRIKGQPVRMIRRFSQSFEHTSPRTE